MDAKLAEALALLTTGIYVLTVREDQRSHGMSSSWVTQVSAEPPLLMAAVDRRHFTHGILERSGRFVLNVVGHEHRELEDYFYSAAARRPDNLDRLGHRPGENGLPILDAAAAALECRVTAAYPAGDHTLFVAEVTRVTVRPGNERPITSQDLDYVYVGEVIRRPR